MTTYHYIPNLRSRDAAKTTEPNQQFKSARKFPSKSAYKAFCADENTQHCFYSLCEGVNSGARIDDSNPVFMCHGIVGDYDAEDGYDWDNYDADLENRVRSLPPTWVTRTQSGFARLIWEFENPICIAPHQYSSFVRAIGRKLGMDSLPGTLDDTSFKPNQYFELGQDWRKMGEPLTDDLIIGEFFRTAKAPDAPIQIPFDVVRDKILEQYSHRLREFEIGQRVPLFWIDDGIERVGAQVFESGVLCYSDRAGKSFCDWSDLLGKNFVSEFENRQISAAVSDFWFDGRGYWGRNPDGIYRTYTESNLKLTLRSLGFSSKVPKGKTLSPLDQAVHHINEYNRIDNAGPFLFRQSGVFDYRGRRVLNTARPTVIKPATDGDPSRWPFIHRFLFQLFEDIDSGNQLDYFFAWLKRAYIASLERRKLSGQAMIIVGNAGHGKTYLSRRIVGPALGGHAEASKYLLGETGFNKDMAESALWCIDDLVAGVNFNAHRTFTEMIKRSVAIPEVEYSAKFENTTLVEWTGRVFITTNEDAASLSVIPTRDSSNADKLIALRLSPANTFQFPPNETVEEITDRELPHFLRWLLDWQEPSYVMGQNRFGVQHYFHPLVDRASRDNSVRTHTIELLDLFAKKFRKYSPQTTIWHGTLVQLASDMRELPELAGSSALRHEERFRHDMRAAEDAHRQNPDSVRPVHSVTTGSGSIWTIDLSEKYDLK